MQMPAKDRIIDLPRLTLFADSPEAGKKARFQFGFRDVNPRVTVFTGVSGAAKDGVISGPLDPVSFQVFLDLFERTIHAEPGTKHKIALKTTQYENNQPTTDMRHLSDLRFGKTEEGIVWIALTTDTHPKIMFEFRPSRFVEFYHADGTTFSDSEMSMLHASAFVKLLRDIFGTHILLSSYTSENRTKPSDTKAKADNTYVEDDIAF